ncbi:MAG: hypothetical protein HY043_22775 [Verrucomicrobia bacterium]|nr:hypothetical protein [Verrucomicrobiota bacterium]
MSKSINPNPYDLDTDFLDRLASQRKLGRRSIQTLKDLREEEQRREESVAELNREIETARQETEPDDEAGVDKLTRLTVRLDLSQRKVSEMPAKIQAEIAAGKEISRTIAGLIQDVGQVLYSKSEARAQEIAALLFEPNRALQIAREAMPVRAAAHFAKAHFLGMVDPLARLEAALAAADKILEADLAEFFPAVPAAAAV